jgi:hypothetical protein
MIYAFLEHARGPEDLRGVMLCRITDSGQTPGIAWWKSPAAYFQGDEGISVFDGMTRENVEREYPGIVVFPNRTAAQEAWQAARYYPEVMKLYTSAIDDVSHSLSAYCDDEGSDIKYQSLIDDIQRGRHWLFGASHVLCGEASELAWLAHRVFI